jgi:phosphoglucomutase
MTDKNAGKMPTQTIDINFFTKEFLSPSSQPAKVKFGTSGHRGVLGAGFCALHARAIAQAVAKMHIEENIKGPVLVGGDTRLMSKATTEICAAVLCANGIKTLLAEIPVPTPVFSFEILAKRAVASLNGTASHNPPQDMGLKYNPSNGGSAESGVTSKIEKYANYFLEHKDEIKEMPLPLAKEQNLIETIDVVSPYVKALGDKIDFKTIKNAALKCAVHPLGGTTLPFWKAIKEKYGLDNLTIASEEQNPTFGFIPLDHDGKIRMDPSSPYPMKPLIDLVKSGKYQFAGACDPDGDRFGCATKMGGLIAPNHALCVMMNYLLTKENPSKEMKAGRSLGTTMLLDKIAKANGYETEEVNVGFKYFVEGLLNNKLFFAGEESAGMSVNNWVTEKDGILAVCLLLEIMSAAAQDICGLYKQLTALYGDPSYTRIDLTADEKAKENLKNFDVKNLVNSGKIAGENIKGVRTTDGVKIYLENSWLLARASGTEAIVKFYAETFGGQKHLDEIIEDGRKLFGL